jgi:DNA-binding transcriptional regulator YiaG
LESVNHDRSHCRCFSVSFIYHSQGVTMTTELSKAAFILSYQDRHSITDARLCDILGVTKSALYAWKTGARAPSTSAHRIVTLLSLLETLAPSIHDHIADKS